MSRKLRIENKTLVLVYLNVDIHVSTKLNNEGLSGLVKCSAKNKMTVSLKGYW